MQIYQSVNLLKLVIEGPVTGREQSQPEYPQQVRHLYNQFVRNWKLERQNETIKR